MIDGNKQNKKKNKHNFKSKQWHKIYINEINKRVSGSKFIDALMQCGSERP